MASPSTTSAQTQQPSAAKNWIQFALLTVLLTGGGLLIVKLVRPTALRGVFSHDDPSQALRGQALVNMAWIEQALLVYAHDNKGQYPATLDALVQPGAKKYFGDLTAVPLDPWKRAFVYDPPSAAHPAPRLRSLGADGQPGGEGENADLDSDLSNARH
jgi:general secretion pathway protein G